MHPGSPDIPEMVQIIGDQIMEDRYVLGLECLLKKVKRTAVTV